MLAAGASAVWAARQDEIIQLGVGVAWCGVYLAMMLAFDSPLEEPQQRLTRYVHYEILIYGGSSR